ncbi:ATP-binding cassette domain-containing protein [Psychrobacter maritimus]|uniref:ATP-binding cassette domain-containing protein n=1 Tax=Psychrobacter maritimus TaxID=256325 RepID=UPI003FD55827
MNLITMKLIVCVIKLSDIKSSMFSFIDLTAGVSQKLIAFIGPNGAGKSTLLHTVLGQHTGTALKTDGHIKIYGQLINEVMNHGHIA